MMQKQGGDGAAFTSAAVPAEETAVTATEDPWEARPRPFEPFFSSSPSPDQQLVLNPSLLSRLAIHSASGPQSRQDASWRRSWLSYSEKFQEDYELVARDGLPPVRVKQSAVAGRAKRLRQGDQQSDPALTGSTVWDAAIACARYLALPPTWDALCARLGKPAGAELTVWELGSGTGLLGLSTASLGLAGSVLLTDLGGVVDLLNENVEYNTGPGRALGNVRRLASNDLCTLCPRVCCASREIKVLDGRVTCAALSVSPPQRNRTRVTVHELRWGDRGSVDAAIRATGGPPDLILARYSYLLSALGPVLPSSSLPLALPCAHDGSSRRENSP